MKKLFTVFCAVLLVFGLSGCADNQTNVSDKREVIVKVGKKKIKKGDVYKCLIATGDVDSVITKIDAILYNKAVETTDEIQKQADNTLKTYKKSIGTKKWKQYLEDQGYDSEEDFVNEVIMPGIKSAYLQETYVKENYDTLVEDYEPLKLEIACITDSDNVKKAKKALEDGASIKTIAKKYGDTSTYSGEAEIYSNKSGLPTMVWTEIKELEKGDTSSSIVDTETAYYYLVKVDETDTSKMKDDITTYLNNLSYTDDDGLAFSDAIYKYYLEKYNFGVYDATVYAGLTSDSAKYEKEEK